MSFFWGWSLCWLALRAVPACWRLRRIPWRRRNTKGILSAIADLPWDRRFVSSLSPLISALAVYGVGVLMAVVLAVGTGGLLGVYSCRLRCSAAV